jgi:hypothetical protein
MGMALEPNDLWPGEQPILTKNANLVIRVKESGLSQFAFDKYMVLIGMKGKEALGGQVHLTNLRLIFKTHGMNRLRGKISMFLPTVTSVTDVSWFIVRKVKVETQIQDYEMVMWGIPSFIEAVEEAKERFKPEHVESLRQLILSNPAPVGEGLMKWVAAERINKVLLAMRKGANAVSEAADLAELPGAEQRSFLELLTLFL